MGSELYAYFRDDAGKPIESGDLAELAADVGADEVPGGGADQVVARLDAASKVSEGEEAELWVDATKLHLFDARSGESLTPGRTG